MLWSMFHVPVRENLHSAVVLHSFHIYLSIYPSTCLSIYLLSFINLYICLSVYPPPHTHTHTEYLAYVIVKPFIFLLIFYPVILLLEVGFTFLNFSYLIIYFSRRFYPLSLIYVVTLFLG